ncbi:unnamed protein product [Hymenolepis diminuta]|uniref:Reverse transcriptase domain-containing protein n=1 Tax=Hymenolepis diminuta TaxID=6216 RepID=A0A0R3SK71_HYMDI|nr:unnamed protein product [Hymenolepis diminuta]
MDLDWIDEFNLIQLPDENETYQTPTPEPTNAKNLILPGLHSNLPLWTQQRRINYATVLSADTSVHSPGMLQDPEDRKRRTEKIILAGTTAGSFGKRTSPAVVAEIVSVHSSNRLFPQERHPSTSYLIDSGVEISVLPSTPSNRITSNQPIILAAANDLGLSRIFRWIFIVADISEPTIGSDFRCHFGLLLDLRIKNPLSPLSLKISLTSPTRFSDKPVNHSVTHSITTHGNPVKARVRHLSPTLCKIAKDEFEHMLDLGIFRRSFSNWSFVLYLVSKKYGDWRPCGDYCALNSIRVPENYPLPNTQDFSSYLRNKKIFSKINLVRAYNRIPMAEADIRKTVITISFGLFKFLRMPFGLRDAAQTFQRFTDEIAVGAVLEQRTGDKAQPLVFFSAKLIPIQPHMQVGEIRYLDYYLHFTNNIRHVKGSDNIAAGCLSRTNAEAVTKAVDFRSIFKAQKSSKLQEFRNRLTSP